MRPYVAKHEKEIDLNFLKLRIKAREIGLLLWEKAAIYGQARFFEILQYFSSHSASLSHSDQVIEQHFVIYFAVNFLIKRQKMFCFGIYEKRQKSKWKNIKEIIVNFLVILQYIGSKLNCFLFCCSSINKLRKKFFQTLIWGCC